MTGNGCGFYRAGRRERGQGRGRRIFGDGTDFRGVGSGLWELLRQEDYLGERRKRWRRVELNGGLRSVAGFLSRLVAQSLFGNRLGFVGAWLEFPRGLDLEGLGPGLVGLGYPRDS